MHGIVELFVLRMITDRPLSRFILTVAIFDSACAIGVRMMMAFRNEWMMSEQQGTRSIIGAEAMRSLGVKLGQVLAAGDVLVLVGDLGAGKTTLTQGMGAGLGITESLESPTFTLMNEYLEGRIPLYHLDLYRLAPEEVDELGLEGYWSGVDAEPGVMVIEWGDRLLALPERWLRLTIGYDGEGRRMQWEAIGDWNAVISVLEE